MRLKGTWWWSLGLTWPAATLRGLSNILCDFVDHPDELKELLSTISRGYLAKLDYLEAEGLLSLNNDGTYVGSGGFGFTDELPQKDFAGKVRCRDLWGFTESQETVNVSPAMYEEFVFPLREADHGPLRPDLLRLLRAAPRAVARRAAASRAAPRLLLAVGGPGEDGRAPGGPVRLVAEAESGGPGRAADRRAGDPQRAPAGPGR